jgi:hypothetical protein
MASVLTKQAGASRTSPILRGRWVSEALLGERLPKPPPNVPPLPQEEPTEGLTMRQIVEKHTGVPECARCHERFDPFGLALEQYDAIGRLRDRPADTHAQLKDGTRFEGIDGLRRYLLEKRRDDFLRLFCRNCWAMRSGGRSPAPTSR